MVGVDSGSLYRRTHSLRRLAWSWVGGRLVPLYIHQMNQVNSHNGSAMMTAPQTLSWNYYYYYYYYYLSTTRINKFGEICNSVFQMHSTDGSTNTGQ